MITRKKDLRTGRPVWTAYRTPVVPVQALKSDIKADVAVIGAGISGAMVAQELAQAGFSVVILDRRGPLKGSTAASTALLQYEIDTPISELSKKIGMDNAVRGWRRSKLGLESLAMKICELDIPCDFERRSSIYLNGNILDDAGLREEQAIRNAAGLRTEYLDRRALEAQFGIRKRSALLGRDELSVNPKKLAAGFLRKAVEDGARIYAPVTVDNVDAHKTGVTVTTAEGPVVRSKHAVFATGYEIPTFIPLKKHKIHSTWALATKPQPSKLWPGRTFIWEAAEPYLYMRATPDGRVICGGEDETFSDEAKRDSLIGEKTVALQRKLRALFPALDTDAEFSWAGSFGGSATDMPSIGPVRGLPNCFAVLAFGGNGITFSRIAAEVILSMLTGRDDPESDLFKLA